MREVPDNAKDQAGNDKLEIAHLASIRRFVAHVHSSVESGDITFVHEVPQGERMRYS